MLSFESMILLSGGLSLAVVGLLAGAAVVSRLARRLTDIYSRLDQLGSHARRDLEAVRDQLAQLDDLKDIRQQLTRLDELDGIKAGLGRLKELDEIKRQLARLDGIEATQGQLARQEDLEAVRGQLARLDRIERAQSKLAVKEDLEALPGHWAQLDGFQHIRQQLSRLDELDGIKKELRRLKQVDEIRRQLARLGALNVMEGQPAPPDGVEAVQGETARQEEPETVRGRLTRLKEFEGAHQQRAQINGGSGLEISPEVGSGIQLSRRGVNVLKAAKIAAQDPLKLPLILISQLQRSGGTLLSQLFDGHPQVLSFPGELHPVKPNWPDASAMFPDLRRFLARHDRMFMQYSMQGYSKYSTIDGGERHPFEYDIGLRDAVMRTILGKMDSPNNREIFDAFFTAFFAAWTSRQASGRKSKYIVAFSARTNMHLAKISAEAFFSDYPDGQLITLVRRPLSWFASARRHNAEYKSFVEAMRLWSESTNSSLELRRRFPAQVALLPFERLVTDTEACMRSLCSRFGLRYNPILCEPTFDGKPIKSDSSFNPSYGIDRSVLSRDDFVPETDQERQLLAAAEELYEKAATTTNLKGAELAAQ